MDQENQIILTADRVIAFRPEIAKFLDSTDAALVYQQLCHWTQYSRDSEGWVYKSADEFYEETNVKEKSLRTARNKLVDMGLVETKKKMANGAYTYHYRVVKHLSTLLTSSTGETPVRNSPRAATITKKTHNINSLVQKHDEDIKKLYKGWLIEMIISPHDWIIASAEERLDLLAAAGRSVRLTSKKKEKLAARLDTYGFEVCARAIRKIAKSPHHRGENDRKWKATLEWLFNTDDKLEEWANR